ncbi:MAG: sulfite exporter TauE/SafE family protein [Verrucomicrobiales bacterium]|nr:sulfite exporter TauE/SafE family protein [Verrucomicrobiales bacterium]
MTSLDPDTLTLGGIFIAGLATSLHCAGMCGLLTCGLGIAGRGPALASVGIYHFCRLVGYGIAGATMGFVGGALGLQFNMSGIPWLPLMLILFLLAITFGLDKKLGAIPGLGKVVMQIRMRTLNLAPPVRAAIIGLATPLLPCGPLYAILALSLAGGSAVRGAEIMLAFGMGALPAIWAVQVGSSWVNRKLGAKGFLVAKRTLAATAALSLMWHFSYIGPTPAGASENGTTCRCE